MVLICRQSYETPSRESAKMQFDAYASRSVIFSVENRKFFSQRAVNKISAFSFAE